MDGRVCRQLKWINEGPIKQLDYLLDICVPSLHTERLVDISYNLKVLKADLHDEQKGFTVQLIISQYGDVSSPLVSGLSVSWSASPTTTC